ncbi:MAG: HD domain-containing protein [Myxococcales bacterium]|nr:HD domain-containing protein [Myxococcales bacterium]
MPRASSRSTRASAGRRLGARLGVRLGARFERAVRLANRLHATQLRKGTRTPYVAHLLAVASIALEHAATEDEAIAALLHDAVEDQGGMLTLARIRRAFGAGVAEIVLGCSDSTAEPKPPWRARKEAYIAHLRTAPSGVLLVSASDKLHNARSILADLRAEGPSVWQRFSAPPTEIVWYYRSLVGAFRAAGAPVALVDELDRTVAALARESRAGRR